MAAGHRDIAVEGNDHQHLASVALGSGAIRVSVAVEGDTLTASPRDVSAFADAVEQAAVDELLDAEDLDLCPGCHDAVESIGFDGQGYPRARPCGCTLYEVIPE